MKRAILFRYHDRLDVCADRIALLRRLNPALPIWGLYGGADLSCPRALDLDSDYALPFAQAAFKWEHGDLCVRRWFRDCGHAYDFDMLHVVEWDLILLRPLSELFEQITDGVAVSDGKFLATLRDEGWGWITDPDRQKQFQELTAHIRRLHGITLDPDTLFVGPYPGASMSRAFLERFSTDDVPVLMHDEIRMCAFAKAYGMPIRDTGLRQRTEFWNCSKLYYSADQVYDKTNKYPVFHPVREALSLAKLFA